MNTTRYTRCPDCKRKGVHFRMKRGEDHYRCRYCDFFFFEPRGDGIDDEARSRWEAANA